jgi:hypothetical protein
MFDFMHLKQKKGEQLNRDIIATHTSLFLVQQEYINMITPSNRITLTI